MPWILFLQNLLLAGGGGQAGFKKRPIYGKKKSTQKKQGNEVDASEQDTEAAKKAEEAAEAAKEAERQRVLREEETEVNVIKRFFLKSNLRNTCFCIHEDTKSVLCTSLHRIVDSHAILHLKGIGCTYNMKLGPNPSLSHNHKGGDSCEGAKSEVQKLMCHGM